MSANLFDIPDKDVRDTFIRLEQELARLFRDESLDSAIFERLQSIYIPLAHWIAGRHTGRTLIIGINGAPGAGKTTLVRLLTLILESGLSKRVLNFSIDDLYYSHEERQSLARQVHPLMATRGLPGTHDVSTGIRLLEQCRSGSKVRTNIPVFDKATDNPKPKEQWRSKQLPVDIVLFEGWFVSARAESEDELIDPVNRLEAEEDKEGIWRRYVNQHLRQEYQQLFGLIDVLIMMKVPSTDCVIQWRILQEEKLAASMPVGRSAPALMDKEQIERFILQDERIMRHQSLEMPERADVILEVGDDHQIDDIKIR